MAIMITPKVHLGMTSDWYEGRIDPGAAIAFALATNDPNGVYLTGEAVPPLYTVSLLQPAFAASARQSVDPGAIKDQKSTVHGEHDVFFWKPVRPGVAVRWRATSHSAKRTPAGVLVTQRLLVTDSENVPLVEHFWSRLHVGGSLEEDQGPELPDHLFRPESRQSPLGQCSFALTADQPFRYAGVSTDDAPIHVDDEAARRAGFPMKILPGLCTLAMCSGAVVKLAGGGDPDRLHRLAGRFAAPVFPRRELEVEIYDAGVSPDGLAVFSFEATSDDAIVIKHGRAELHPA
jgi:acyl dehydratase